MEALPDELWARVLYFVVALPDERFTDMSTPRNAPRTRRAISSSGVLLVCKASMRIATPALYHTVVLRSALQVTSFCAALKQHPPLAKLIKRLRVEEHYNSLELAQLAQVIRQMHNLDAFSFRPPAYFDKTLDAIFAAMNPCHFYMLRPAHFIPPDFNRFGDNLSHEIRSWDRMVRVLSCVSCGTESLAKRTVTLPLWETSYEDDSWFRACVNMISNSTSLRDVILPVNCAEDLTNTAATSLMEQILAASRQTRVIVVLPEPIQVESWFLVRVPVDRQAQLFFQRRGGGPIKTYDDIVLARNQPFPRWAIALEQATLTARNKVLRLVFSFAIQRQSPSPGFVRLVRHWFSVKDVDLRSTSALMLTCREFSVRPLLLSSMLL